LLPTLVKRTLLVLAGNGVSKLLLVAFEFAVAAILGATQYGLFSICFALLLIVSNISILGLDYGIVQNLSIYQEQQRLDRVRSLIISSLIMVGASGLIAGLTICLGANLLAVRVFNKPELATPLLLIGIAVPFEALNQAISAIFRGLRRYRDHIVSIDLARNIVLIVSVPVMIWLNIQLNLLIMFVLFGSLFGSILGMNKLRSYIGGSSLWNANIWSTARELIAFSYKLFIWNIFQKLAGRSQTLLAGIFLTSAQVGVFAVFLRIVLVFTFIQTAVNQTSPVEFARLNYLGEFNRLKSMYQASTRVLLIATMFLALPLVVRPDILLAAFGAEYVPFAWLLLPLVVSEFIDVGTGPIGQLLISCRKQSSIFIVSVIGSIIQVVLSVLLMPLYGIAGAVSAEVVTSISLTVIRHIASHTLLKIHSFTWEFLILCVAGVVSALLGWQLAEVFDNTLGYTLGVSLACLGFLMSLIVYSFVNKLFQKQVLLMLGRFRG
jgi:O-antigen/teichoic acid export membrane protein